jgi:uncharacterized DUF497 family protein
MPKAVVFTSHARARMLSRELHIEWVEEAAREPDWTEPDPGDPSVERRFRIVGNRGGGILRVACVETSTAIRVISAMFDRNARRKP